MKYIYKNLIVNFMSIITLTISSILIIYAAFALTGRLSLPCGEDSWRFGLMQYVIGKPIILANIIISLPLYLTLKTLIGFAAKKSLSYSLAAQLVATVCGLIILTWPNVIYTSNIVCE